MSQQFLICFIRHVHQIVKSDYWFHVCLSLSVRMEQLSSHWTDFNEIWYFSIFQRPVKKIKVSLLYEKNNGYDTWRPMNIWQYLTQFFSE